MTGMNDLSSFSCLYAFLISFNILLIWGLSSWYSYPPRFPIGEPWVLELLLLTSNVRKAFALRSHASHLRKIPA